MTATLTFNLPEEDAEHTQALRAGHMASVLCEVDNLLRGWIKHGTPRTHTDASDAFEQLRSVMSEVMDVARGEV